MRTENTTHPTRLLRVRELPEQLRKQPRKRGESSPKSRFIAPYYFQTEEQTAIAALLEQAQLSDNEGRRLFITAMEYEVASYCLTPDEGPTPVVAAVAAPKPKSKAEIELVDLGRSAEQLLALLQGTHKTARKTLVERLTDTDAFGREHGERYLNQLELELGRIAEVCGQEEVAQEVPQAPPLGENARRLIVQLTRIYGECLEVNLIPDQMDTFARILCIIRDSAQIAIPCDPETLAGVVQETL
jgi:hypothetical protein